MYDLHFIQRILIGLYFLMMVANDFSANQIQRKIIAWFLREG